VDGETIKGRALQLAGHALLVRMNRLLRQAQRSPRWNGSENEHEQE